MGPAWCLCLPAIKLDDFPGSGGGLRGGLRLCRQEEGEAGAGQDEEEGEAAGGRVLGGQQRLAAQWLDDEGRAGQSKWEDCISGRIHGSIASTPSQADLTAGGQQH